MSENNEWILVKDELPKVKPNESILVTRDYKEHRRFVSTATYWYTNKTFTIGCGKFAEDITNEVVAWRRFPEPYND